MDLSTTTLAVLAGGRGARMGMPKTALQLDNQPILAWQLGRLHWPGPTLLVTSPALANPPGAERFDRCASDKVEGLGPLAGLTTMFDHLATPTAAVITVDMPLITRDQIAWLLGALTAQPDCLGLLCEVQTARGPMIEPFPSVYRAGAAITIVRRVAAGQLAIHDLRNESGFRVINPHPSWPQSAWTNLNYPKDMAAFQLSRNESPTENPT